MKTKERIIENIDKLEAKRKDIELWIAKEQGRLEEIEQEISRFVELLGTES